MSKGKYENITRCLHISNDNVSDNDERRAMDLKLAKMGWLLADIKEKCKLNWNFNQEVTVDESMVRYKGKYCPIR